MASAVKFVASDATGLPLKRHQAPQACERCRARKKRCVHGDNTLYGRREVSAPSRRLGVKPGARSSPEEAPKDLGQNHDGHSTRYVGDMNPEHLLIQATSPHASRDRSIQGGIGVWKSGGAAGLQSINARPQADPALQELLSNYVRSRCLVLCPTGPDFEKLNSIYLEKLDPLLPVLGRGRSSRPSDSPEAIVMRQLISLAAATDPGAHEYLRLKSDGPVLSPLEFCSAISTAIQSTLDSGVITDRVWLTRCFLLFSFCMQPLNVEDADVPSLMCTRAVHQIYTAGMHLPAEQANPRTEEFESLFLGVWALDRLNAAFYGRACVIHDRDIGWDMNESIARQQPPFRLLLLITRLLDEVIELYRPSKRHSDAPNYVEMPVLEQLIINAGATKVSSPVLATLEVFYHAISVLSCRQRPESVAQTPSSTLNSRRSLSADRIAGIISHEFPNQLCYTPILPYAVSLSLSVAYRKMRYSRVPMFRVRGKREFEAITGLLRDLGSAFWTARTMTALAEQVLREMDKAVASIAQDSAASDDVIFSAPCPRPGTTFDDVANDIVQSPSTPAHTPLADVNATMLEIPPDLDVFGYMDPNFNLESVDAALEGALDFGTSSNWYDWQQLWSNP